MRTSTRSLLSCHFSFFLLFLVLASVFSLSLFFHLLTTRPRCFALSLSLSFVLFLLCLVFFRLLSFFSLHFIFCHLDKMLSYLSSSFGLLSFSSFIFTISLSLLFPPPCILSNNSLLFSYSRSIFLILLALSIPSSSSYLSISLYLSPPLLTLSRASIKP